MCLCSTVGGLNDQNRWQELSDTGDYMYLAVLLISTKKYSEMCKKVDLTMHLCRFDARKVIRPVKIQVWHSTKELNRDNFQCELFHVCRIGLIHLLAR